MSRRGWSDFARHPAVHFALAGTLLFAGSRALPRERPELVVDAARVRALAAQWERRAGAPPDAEARERLVQAWIDEEILFREALALGLAERSGIVRSRLARLVRYLEEGGTGAAEAAAAPAAVPAAWAAPAGTGGAAALSAEGGVALPFPGEAGPAADGGTALAAGGGAAPAADAEAALAAKGEALGLLEVDPVIRRTLVGAMRLALSRIPPSALPDEAALAHYLAAHAERFRRPARYRLRHVYLSRARRGAALADDARALLERLRAEDAPEPGRAGDAFAAAGSSLVASEAELDRIFGPGVGAAVAALRPGHFAGPVASPHGLHLFRVEEVLPAWLPRLGEIRGEVLHAWLRERRRERLEAALAELRARYRIRVDGEGG